MKLKLTDKMICRLLHPNNFTSYFCLLVCPPSLPQWRTKETEYAEDRQQLLDSSDEEEPESSTTGKCHIRRVSHEISNKLKFK